MVRGNADEESHSKRFYLIGQEKYLAERLNCSVLCSNQPSSLECQRFLTPRTIIGILVDGLFVDVFCGG